MLENAMVLGAWPYDQANAPDPAHFCPVCGCETTYEEYEVNGKWICGHCFDDYIAGLTRIGLADLMGIEWRTAIE